MQRLAELRVIFRNGDERRQPATPLFDADALRTGESATVADLNRGRDHYDAFVITGDDERSAVPRGSSKSRPPSPRPSPPPNGTP